MKRKNSINQTYNWDVLAYCVSMLLVVVMLVKKCRYGFGHMDEAFYISLPYRLVQGDGLFINEWHLSQMSSFLMFPFVKLYLLLKGNTEGIILIFRYLYVAVKFLAVTIIYAQLRKFSKVGSLLAALFLMIHSPMGMMALSYNSLGIICLSTGLVLIICSEKKLSHFISGALFACAVLCCPFLALLYVIYALFVLLSYICHWKNNLVFFECSRFIRFTIGIAIMAIIFLIFVFSKISIQQLFDVLPSILSDPEHEATLASKIDSFIYVVFFNRYTKIIFALYSFVFLIGVLVKNKRVKYVCVIFSIALTILHLLNYFIYGYNINIFMLPINICAFICYFLFREAWMDDLFYGIWVPGFFYAICINFTSNQGLYAISSAMSVSLVSSVIIVVEVVKHIARDMELQFFKTICIASLVGLISFQSFSELYFAWNKIYWENSLDEQTVLLETGPEAGLYVSKERADLYDYYMDELVYLNDANQVVFVSHNSWLYLCGSWKNGGISAWPIGGFFGHSEPWVAYYNINPEKKPDYVFIDNVFSAWIEFFMSVDDYTVTTTKEGNYVLKR